MKRSLITLAAAATLACGPKSADTAADTSVRQTGNTNDPATVQRALDSTMAAFRDAMMKGDTSASLRMYADDAQVLMANSKIVNGRAEIAKWHAGMFAGMSVPAAKFTSHDLIVSGDYAIETGAYDMTFKPKKGKAIHDVGKFLTVWKRQADGSWKLLRDSFSSDLPAT